MEEIASARVKGLGVPRLLEAAPMLFGKIDTIPSIHLAICVTMPGFAQTQSGSGSVKFRHGQDLKRRRSGELQ